MEDIHYKNNYLKEVVLQLDFIQPNKILAESILPEKLLSIIQSNYPISNSQISFGKQINFEPNGVSANEIRTQQHIFSNFDKTQTIYLNHNCILITYKKYNSFKDFSNTNYPILNTFLNLEQNILISRVGFRYLNVFDHINKKDLISKYFHQSISSNYKNILEYRKDNINTRIQSGLFNPDFPSLIKNHHFLLDLDCYIFMQQVFDIDIVNDLHNTIQIKFEELITEKMRGFLNGA